MEPTSESLSPPAMPRAPLSLPVPGPARPCLRLPAPPPLLRPRPPFPVSLLALLLQVLARFRRRCPGTATGFHLSRRLQRAANRGGEVMTGLIERHIGERARVTAP